MKNWIMAFIIFFIIFLLAFLIRKRDHDKLNKCSKTHVAVLERKYRAGKKKYVELSMNLNGEKISFHHTLSNMLSAAQVGDSINVIYACENPEIADVIE